MTIDIITEFEVLEYAHTDILTQRFYHLLEPFSYRVGGVDYMYVDEHNGNPRSMKDTIKTLLDDVLQYAPNRRNR